MKHRNVDAQYLRAFPYYGRHGQDKYLNEEVFGRKRHGVFVDLGAYDGIESSNTLFFEESLGWGGVCVEPLPDAFAKLQLNRRSLCLNVCASDSYRQASFTHVIPGMNNRNPVEGRAPNYEKLSGLIEFYNAEQVKVIERVLQETGGKKEFLDVQCVPVNYILEQAQSSRIDLLSLDTEGSEFHILQSIDFGWYDIDVIVIEVLYPSEDFDDFMNRHRYKLIKKVGYDWVYRKMTLGCSLASSGACE